MKESTKEASNSQINEIKIEDKIVQPSQLFDLWGIKDTEETRKVFRWTLNLLLNLKKGDQITISTGFFQKLTEDLIYCDANLDKNQIVDTLEHKKIIKFPV